MYLDFEDPEVRKVYLDDMKSKKAAAKGASAVASKKRGIKGSVRFPSDEIINNKKKWEKNNGKVKVYYMDGYEVPVIDFETELPKLTLKEEADLLRKYKNDKNVGWDRLIHLWPVTKSWIVNVLYQYNLATRNGKDPGTMKPMLTKELRKKLGLNKKEPLEIEQLNNDNIITHDENMELPSSVVLNDCSISKPVPASIDKFIKAEIDEPGEEMNTVYKITAPGKKIMGRLDAISQSLDEDVVYEIYVTIKTK